MDHALIDVHFSHNVISYRKDTPAFYLTIIYHISMYAKVSWDINKVIIMISFILMTCIFDQDKEIEWLVATISILAICSQTHYGNWSLTELMG